MILDQSILIKYFGNNKKYNPDIHCRVNDGDIVQFCVYPALQKIDNEYETDIYVFCVE